MGNCLCGELSEWGIVHWGIVLVGNCPVGNCAFTCYIGSLFLVGVNYITMRIMS